MPLNSLFKQPAFCFAKHPPPWYLDALSYLCIRVSSFPAGKGKGQAGMLISQSSSPAPIPAPLLEEEQRAGQGEEQSTELQCCSSSRALEDVLK